MSQAHWGEREVVHVERDGKSVEHSIERAFTIVVEKGRD
jgi:hypothetical protein